ncbi:MAG TPA: thiamine phosphate synthase [Pyrinomonadaceae bacterium]|nr:thiamine phosphate synthase [Pyrinomonadaceae bacterium]
MTIEPPITYLITSGELTQENFTSRSDEFVRLLAEAAADGVDVIQIREKALSARNLSFLSSRLADSLKGSRTKLLVNDRTDIAKAAGSDGVHLTTRSLSVEAVRKIVGAEGVISCSAHTIAEVKRAGDAGADIILFGPVFASPGKGEAVGLDALVEAVNAAGDSKLLALGGIDERNFTEALESGADGVAAIRSLNDRASRRVIIGGR